MRAVRTISLVALTVLLGACARKTSVLATEPPLHTVDVTFAPVESNPPGDIPDSQQFVGYSSAAGGYRVKVPEGWARTTKGSNVTFADKLHEIRVEIVSASSARTPSSVRRVDEPGVRTSVHGFQEIKIVRADVPAGPAVLFRYRLNSAPTATTGKSLRMEVDRYEIYANHRLAMLSMMAPAGSDNVDVWRLVSRSFAWTK